MFADLDISNKFSSNDNRFSNKDLEIFNKYCIDRFFLYALIWSNNKTELCIQSQPFISGNGDNVYNSKVTLLYEYLRTYWQAFTVFKIIAESKKFQCTRGHFNRLPQFLSQVSNIFLGLSELGEYISVITVFRAHLSGPFSHLASHVPLVLGHTCPSPGLGSSPSSVAWTCPIPALALWTGCMWTLAHSSSTR